MNTPYDTGKVKIGINYKPPIYMECDRDMLYLQSCLLRKDSTSYKQFTCVALLVLLTFGWFLFK